MFAKYWLWNAMLLAVCTGAHAADPRAVWEQAVQAKGGRERLRKVQTLAIFMKPAQVVLAVARANWHYIFPDRYVEWEGRKGVQHSIVVDGTAGRIVVDANGHVRAAWSVIAVERERIPLNQVV